MDRGLYRVLPARPIGLDQGLAKLRHTHGARLTLKNTCRAWHTTKRVSGRKKAASLTLAVRDRVHTSDPCLERDLSHKVKYVELSSCTEKEYIH